MKNRHRNIGAAYRDQRGESHDAAGESRPFASRDYRFDMK
jgi:hypothetical protein